MRPWKKPLASGAVSPRPVRSAGLAALFMGFVTLSTSCGEAGAMSKEVARSAPPQQANIGPLPNLRQALQNIAPATCQELKNLNPQAVDGEYVLYLNGDPTEPWTAWCHNMAGTPSEYLTLKKAGASNFSQYTAGWAASGSNVRTNYFKLRIDPATLRVNTADQTFSYSWGQLTQADQFEVSSMPYASAMSCDWSPSGLANLDLRGTPFTVAADQFSIWGYHPAGEILYSNGAQVVDLTGGGYCGWNSLNGIINPSNQNGGQLALVYIDTTQPETRIDSAPPRETNLPIPSFSFGSNESSVIFECSLDEAPFAECPDAFPSLDDGTHQLAVRARDEAGNVDPSVAQYSWQVDTVPPGAPSLQEPASGQTLLTVRPVFSGTAEPDTTVTLLVDGVAVGSAQTDAQGVWSGMPGAELSWGAHRASALATDRVGNASSPLSEVPFSISPRGNYRMGCAASPFPWQAPWPWAVLLLGLLRRRARP